mmetsp:Transcript_79840/g.229192  ORF Transcript_79840/g.229192 Transcript_79840/m.229192 type:complete len:224 (-) Transcript_79840:534-1205(-)
MLCVIQNLNSKTHYKYIAGDCNPIRIRPATAYEQQPPAPHSLPMVWAWKAVGRDLQLSANSKWHRVTECEQATSFAALAAAIVALRRHRRKRLPLLGRGDAAVTLFWTPLSRHGLGPLVEGPPPGTSAQGPILRIRRRQELRRQVSLALLVVGLPSALLLLPPLCRFSRQGTSQHRLKELFTEDAALLVPHRRSVLPDLLRGLRHDAVFLEGSTAFLAAPLLH